MSVMQGVEQKDKGNMTVDELINALQKCRDFFGRDVPVLMAGVGGNCISLGGAENGVEGGKDVVVIFPSEDCEEQYCWKDEERESVFAIQKNAVCSFLYSNSHFQDCSNAEIYGLVITRENIIEKGWDKNIIGKLCRMVKDGGWKVHEWRVDFWAYSIEVLLCKEKENV